MTQHPNELIDILTIFAKEHDYTRSHNMNMTRHLSIMFPSALLDTLDAFAKGHGYTRSQIVRLIIGLVLDKPEVYMPPTLPNWQVEAWTALLHGIYGDTRLVLTADIKAVLRLAVAALNERDRQVLRLRFGLRGPRHTLAEVGAIFGVQRSRIHQVERSALGRVRRWLRTRGIWELLEGQLGKEEAE